MEPNQYQTQGHLFICCRKRDQKPCCANHGAENLVSHLKDWVKKKGLKNKIKVSQSSCLGFCETGITACLYPQNKWLHHIRLKDQKSLEKLLEDCANSPISPKS